MDKYFECLIAIEHFLSSYLYINSGGEASPSPSVIKQLQSVRKTRQVSGRYPVHS